MIYTQPNLGTMLILEGPITLRNLLVRYVGFYARMLLNLFGASLRYAAGFRIMLLRILLACHKQVTEMDP